MVTVIGSQNDEDWFQTLYESQISGLLVAESGQDYFILTEYRIVKNVDRIQIVFCDGTMIDGRFLKEDTNTGFAILKVPKTMVPDETKAAIAIAPLGDSRYVRQGEPVLAIGSPMGYSDSVGYGIVTSTTNTVSKVDAEYGLITTDIPGSNKGSGVFLNL
ncbi:serine protease, typically periplasmic, partial [gut metagenome]